MVRRIVQQIVKITNKPGRQNLKTISAKIVAEWPGCFEDRIGDIIIGSGYHSLFTQLENGMDNANRCSVETVARKRLVLSADQRADGNDLQSSEQKRSKVTDQYGCINANPKKPPEGETLETLEEKRLTMIDLFHARQGES
jgi:hypothetical protein